MLEDAFCLQTLLFGAAFKDDECLNEGSTHYPFQPAATDTKHEHPPSTVGSAA